MPAYKASHPQKDEKNEIHEIVGTKDLRETFTDKDRVRGGLIINGYTLAQFEANSPANLVALLNAKKAHTHVDAEIDDGGHLVLSGNGPIRILAGPAYEEPPPATGDVGASIVRGMKELREEDRRDGDDKKKNTILEDLGLTATEKTEDGTPLRPGFETGASAEDRKKRREAHKAEAGAAHAPTGGKVIVAGQTDEAPVSPSAPVAPGGDGSHMADGGSRIGQGEGYSAHPDGTPPVRGTPAWDAGTRSDAADNSAPKASPPSAAP